MLNTIRDISVPMYCRVCKGATYSYALTFSKVTASLTEKLYNINYTRAGNIFGKFHKTKACCQRIATRLPIANFKMSKNDKQVYKRFLNFLKGTYSLEKAKSEEEKKQPPMSQAQIFREQINQKLLKSGLTHIFGNLEETLAKHKLVRDAAHNLISSNLAMLGFYRDKKMSLKDYQESVKTPLVEAVVEVVGEKSEKVELHDKGFINIYFTSLKNQEEIKEAKEKEEEKKEETKNKGVSDGTTNLQEYFDEMIALG